MQAQFLLFSPPLPTAAVLSPDDHNTSDDDDGVARENDVDHQQWYMDRRLDLIFNTRSEVELGREMKMGSSREDVSWPLQKGVERTCMIAFLKGLP